MDMDPPTIRIPLVSALQRTRAAQRLQSGADHGAGARSVEFSSARGFEVSFWFPLKPTPKKGKVLFTLSVKNKRIVTSSFRASPSQAGSGMGESSRCVPFCFPFKHT